MSSNGYNSNIQSPALDSLQKWMQEVVTSPGGVIAGVHSANQRSGFLAGPDTLEEIIAPSATLSGAQRLAIYNRSYHARLLQCFQSLFPALLHALGEGLFNHFALDYLEHYPPHSYTLDRIADDFPRHLAATRPDAAPPEERESWPDFIIELAKLELAFMEIFDGPGAEGENLPDARDLLAIPVGRMHAMRFIPVPSRRLFASAYPVGAYLLAVHRKESPGLPGPAGSFLAIARRNYRVMLHELTATQYALLCALDEYRTVEEALAGMGEDVKPSISLVREWLCEWGAKGFFRTIELAG